MTKSYVNVKTLNNLAPNIAYIRANNVLAANLPQTSLLIGGDGGGAVYKIDPTDTTSLDDGAGILVDAVGQRWRRQFYNGLSTRGPTFFVDSVGGNNSNAGTSTTTPVQTIAQALTLASGISNPQILLKRGSVFREQFQIPDQAYVGVYGESGAAPIVSGADLVANASFSLTPAQVNTYRVALSNIPATTNSYVGVTNSDVLMVWENNTRLGLTFNQSGYTRPASIADVEATAGSFWWDSVNKILYVHPTGSTNPITNGKTYEISVRTLCLHGGDGFFVQGLIAEKAGAKTSTGQQGYAILGFKSGHYKNCVGRQAWNHAIGVANGEIADDLIFDECLAEDCERQVISYPTNFVAFKSGAKPSKVIIRNCIARQLTPWAGAGSFGEVGFFHHGPSIICEYQGVNYTQNMRYGVQILKDTGATMATCYINGSWVFDNCVTGFYYATMADAGAFVSVQAKNCELALDLRRSCDVFARIIDCTNGIQAGFGTAGSPVTVNVRDTMIIQKTAAVLQNDNTGIQAFGAFSKFTVRDTLFHNLGCAIRGDNDTNNPITTSDYNQFSTLVRVWSSINLTPTFGTTLSGWQSASGQDANSSNAAATITFSDRRFPNVTPALSSVL